MKNPFLFTPVVGSADRAAAALGYRVSSDELQAGLDVRALSFTSLPVELLRELMRMRKAWGSEAPALRDSAFMP